MYFDAFTISALVDEFMDTLVGGRVQDSIDVEADAIGLEIYADRQRRYLYMSADHQVPRVHLVEDKLRRGIPKPTQLGLLFRRYVEGGIVAHVSQPEWERILHIDVEGPEGEVSIIIEPMERRSNILLVRDGVILDCMRRVGPQDNRYRLSLPGHEYIPPPPMTGRHDPLQLQLEDLAGLYEQNEDPKRKAFQILSSRLFGFSPLLAREIIFRAHGDTKIKANDANIDAIFEQIKTVVTPLGQREWQPGIAEVDGLAEAFSVYPLEHLEGWQAVETVSEAAVQYYGAPTGEEAYTAAKKPVFKQIDEAVAKLSAKLASLQRSLKDDSEREHLRQSGELILAYQYTLQEGQTELHAQYEVDEPELVIKLNPDLTPLENAQRYFEKYDKAKRALKDVPRLVDETQNELDYVKQLATDLEMASNWPEIDEVQQILQKKGYWRGRRAKRIGGGGQSAPIRHVTQDGFVIWVGRNSRQNEDVSFKKAKGDDFWLHAREVPGAHVVIKFDGRKIPEDVIDTAASLAAFYSARRADGKVPVDVTRIKYVRKIKGAGPGMVTYRNETTRIAIPQSEKMLQNSS